MIRLLILFLKQMSKGTIMKVIIPIIAIIVSFFYNKLLGSFLVITYIGYLLYINKAKIYMLLGNISYSKNNMQDALKWFGKAYNNGNCTPNSGVSYGYLLLRSGQVNEAEQVIGSFMDKQIDDNSKMLTKSNYALVLWKKGELDKAINLFKEVYEQYKNSTVYGSLGYLLIVRGDLDEALRFNLEAYEYNDSNAIILDNLGQIYYLRGEYAKAEEIYDKLMPMNPSFPEAYYNYGLLLLAQQKSKEALENMKKALTYKFTFLSTVRQEEVEDKIRELEQQGEKM